MSKSTKRYQPVIEKLERLKAVKRAILFGSRAAGDAAERADIDVALSCPGLRAKDWPEVAEHVRDARTLLSIDVVWLEQAAADLQAEITATGRIIYERT